MRPDATPSTPPEPILDPDQRIVDTHHHLFDRPGLRYLVEELVADLKAGHRIVDTVYLQALARYCPDGPEAMRPIGETEFAASVGERFATGEFGPLRACGGIISFADLTRGDAVQPVLEAHAVAGRGRFRGLRHLASWDSDPTLNNPAYPAPPGLLGSDGFRAGFRNLDRMGLVFETYVFFHQLPEVTALARAFPGTPIVVNHCGGHLGTVRFAGRDAEVMAEWSANLRELAICPNTMMKLGGLGMARSGFGFETRITPVLSDEVARAWKPWVQTCVDIFGAQRCMVSSNFPVDRVSCSYPVLWNAFKRILSAASPDEKDALFWRNAVRCYGLAEPA